MVGLLGCGCCTGDCCSNGTTTWIETFSNTPNGQPYDEFTNITGPNCRATCPPPSTLVGLGNQYLKTSTLQINADSSSPMYLGLTGFPNGAKFTAGWISSSNASQWSVMVPPLGFYNEMGMFISTELIFKFETFTYYSGSGIAFYKQLNNSYFQGLIYTYGVRQSNGYYRIDNGPNLPENQISGVPFINSPRFLDWDIENLYQPDNTAVGVNKCKYFYEEKKGKDNTSGQSFRNLKIPGFIPKGTLPQPPETFQCYVGWKSTVTWYTYTEFGMRGTGAFDFKNEYVSWKPTTWMPYIP